MSDAKETVWYLRPKYLFVIFTCANTLLFIDRGIVPGASNEFNAFIKDNVDTSTPDVFLGLLQSAFIVGLAVGSSIFGHLVHYHPRFFLTGVGCAIWMLAVVLSGMARYANSYTFLVFARMLSGVGEASLQVNIPPWIQKTAPPLERGIWLSIFFTAIPVGTATGYAYSSIMAENLGWEWAYFVEAIFMAPLVFFMFTIAHHFPIEAHGDEDSSVGHHGVGSYTAPAPNSRTSSKDQLGGSSKDTHGEPSARLQILPPDSTMSEEDRLRARSTSNNSASGAAKKLVSVELGSPVADPDGDFAPRRKHKPTVLEEFGVVFSKPLFLCLVAGYAAQTAMLIGLSTFGSAFMMGLGYFNTESQSSTIFGALICMSGVIATPLGGIMLDRMLATATLRTNPQDPAQPHLQHFDNEAALSGAVGEVVRNAVLEAEYEAEHENLAQASQRTDATAHQLRATEAFAHGQSMSLRQQQQAGAQRGDSSPVPAGEDSDVLKRRKMDAIAQLITISSLVGCGLLCLCYWLHDRFAFLGLVTVGVGILFFCTPAINMGFMLAVPTENQSFGLAMMVVFMHSLGDVPSPILVGLIKDTLAPGCVGDEDDDGQDAATSADCRDDAPGLRLTILLVCMWLLWCVFFFGLVWYLNHFHRHTVEHCTYCIPGGRLCPCVKVQHDGDADQDSDSDGENSPMEKNKLLSKLIPSSNST